MSDEQTLRFYAQNAAQYVLHGDGQPGAQLLAFLGALQAGAHILELGTGSGADAAAMIARGFAVTPSDASPELAARAERRLDRPVRILRFDQLDDIDRYDGIWASAALLHAPAAELTGALSRIYRALRPCGRLVASFKAGNGEGRDGFGRYYNYPSAEGLLSCTKNAAHWHTLDLGEIDGTGYDQLPTRWLWLTATKA